MPPPSPSPPPLFLYTKKKNITKLFDNIPSGHEREECINQISISFFIPTPVGRHFYFRIILSRIFFTTGNKNKPSEYKITLKMIHVSQFIHRRARVRTHTHTRRAWLVFVGMGVRVCLCANEH